MNLTDLRQLLDQQATLADFAPVDPDSIVSAARSRRKRRAITGGFVGLIAVGAAALAIATAGSDTARPAILVPATSPTGALPTGKIIPPAERESAPSLAGETVTGNRFDLAAQRGNVVAVNFWGSWCAPCRAQGPMLQRVSDATASRGVTFIGVDARDTRSDAKTYIDAKHITYPSIVDAAGSITRTWPAPYGPPFTFIVDRQGRIAALFTGRVTDSQLERAIDSVAAETVPVRVRVATRHEWFQYGDASLDPPAPGRAPADPTSAWKRIAATLPGSLCDGGTKMRVEYGLFTNYLVVSTGPLRYRPYDYNKVPEWVVRCVDVPQPPSKGSGLILQGQSPQPTPTAQPTPALVDMISIFDPHTGKLLIGFDDPAS